VTRRALPSLAMSCGGLTCAHCAASQGKAAFDAFDPFAKQPKMSYKDGYQKRYFVLDSFHDGAEQLKAYCASLHLPADLPDPDRKTL